MLLHLARAADALEHAEEDDDPSSQEAQGQLPAHGAGVMEALAVHDAQNALTARQTETEKRHTYRDLTEAK